MFGRKGLGTSAAARPASTPLPIVDLDDDERADLEARIAWLKQASPDDWHGAALDFNWCEPLYLLDWIVRQDNCDLATALCIFWSGEPACWIEEAGSGDEAPNGYSYLNKKLCEYISDRVERNGYSRSEIAFIPDISNKSFYLELAELAAELSAPNIRAPRSLIQSRSGRRVVNAAEFYRRYPQHFHYSVSLDLPDLTPEEHARLLGPVEAANEKARRSFPAWLKG